MNISKRKLLIISLFTAILVWAKPKQTSGVFDITDKSGDSVFLEWYEVDDLEVFLPLIEKFLPVMAEAFADELRNFLLDDQFKIRLEYVELFGKLPQDIKEQLNAKITIARYEKREERVQARMQSYKQTFNNGFARDLVRNKPLVIIAKNGKNKILGFTLFLRKHPEWEILSNEWQKDFIWCEFLAIMPEAQGRGLTRPLLFSILKLMPDTTRIVLGTTSWNTKAHKIYEHLGCKRIIHNEQNSLACDCYYEYVVINYLGGRTGILS